MQANLVLAGVGGQGILSIAQVIDRAAVAAGLHLKQAEVHGMSQRGGAVDSHLRLSDGPIASDLVPIGAADLVLAVEPLEALRHAHYLKPDGMLVASMTPLVNIANYPPLAEVLARIQAAIQQIGDTRRAGGAGSRRESAVNELIEIGPASLSALEAALDDEANQYRKMNAARAIAGIARADNRLALYANLIPKLLLRLRDPRRHVRIAANQALEAISGKSVGFREPEDDEILPDELEAGARWAAWWDEVKQAVK